MSDLYSANGQVAAVTPSPGKSCLGIEAIATRRARVYLLIGGCDGSPVADNILNWLVRRFTAAGTGTVVASEPLDPAGPVSALVTKQNYTAEPTFGGTLFNFALHQRATWQWQAAPGRELLIAAVAGAGLAVTPQHASYGGTARATLQWSE